MKTTNLERVRRTSRSLERQWAVVRGITEDRNAAIIAAHQDGVSQADLATVAGLSPQRISQLVYDAAEDNNGDLH